MALDREIEAKYDVIAKMGEGGMGSVFKVRHKYFGDVRVIKTMRHQESESQRARFISEAKRGYQLRHDGIARVLDFAITTDGTAYIEMDFIDGIDCRKALAQSGGFLIPDRAVDIAAQTLDALKYLHDQGIVHRDISPDNLMLTRGPGDKPLVKLIDLGIAKSVQSSQSFTMAGKFVGKVIYAAPEQLSGEVDPRSDLYALGIVLYELLTGKVPFRSLDYREVMMAHITGELIPFSESDPEGRVPHGLRAVVAQALQRHVEVRFQKADDFKRALLDLQAPLPIDRTSPVDTLTSHSRGEQAAWQAASQENTPDAWEAYLEQYGTSPRAGQARERLKELERIEAEDWRVAENEQSVTAWRSFIEKHPESTRIWQARRRLEQAEVELKDWEAASRADTVAAWTDYLGAYPLSARSAEAKRRLAAIRFNEAEVVAWNAAEKVDDSRAWAEYLDRFGASSRVDDARARLRAASAREKEASLWTEASALDTVQGWDAYLASFPDSARAADARARRRRADAAAEQRDWASLPAWASLVELRAFLEAHPDGFFAREAQARLADLEEREAEDRDWRAAEESGSFDAWRTYLSRHSHSRRADAARARADAAGTRELDDRAWAEASSVDTAAAWQDYLDRQPNSARAGEARVRLASARERDRQQADFESARRDDTSDAWRSFLSRHPEGHRVAEARQRLDELIEADLEKESWERAVATATPAEWQQYVDRFPRSVRIAEARKRLTAATAEDEEAFDFQSAAAEDTALAWGSFIAKYAAPAAKLAGRKRGKASRVAEARKRLAAARQREDTARIADEERQRRESESEAWNQAVSLNTAAGWQAYLTQYPGGDRSEEAAQRLSDARTEERKLRVPNGESDPELAQDTVRRAWRAYRDGTLSDTGARTTQERLEVSRQKQEETECWLRAESEGGTAAWQRFLDRFPGSSRVAEARVRLSMARNEEIEQRDFDAALAAPTVEAWTRFIAMYPAGQRILEAQQRLALARELEAFDDAITAGSELALSAFLARHPKSPLAAEVKVRLAAVRAKPAARKPTRESSREPARQPTREQTVEVDLNEVDLAEEKAWAAAKHRNTAERYEKFLAKYGESQHAPEARRRLDDLRRGPHDAGGPNASP